MNTKNDIKNVYNEIETEFFDQTNLTSHEELKYIDTTIAVFSCEPFGFEFPDKEYLKKLSPHRLSKKYFLMKKAKKIFNELLEQVKNDSVNIFEEKKNLVQKELSPWLIILKQFNELKRIIDSYMPNYNICWDCQTFKSNPFKIDQKILFCITLWIQLETENISIYRNIYKV
ncbi:MAG: hypothetical protein LBP59_03070 [Planctomycetaceae bacterium]|jgi:hypothetical protein|nr:hypothetical protein [Planctomycetaceae bacterium]